MELENRIRTAAAYLLRAVPSRPTVGMVLGSGLGDFADTLENAVSIPFSDIPNFPIPTVPGHAGALVFGRKQGRDVVILQGRIHYYEGLSQQELTLPIRVLAALGVKTLVLTNACGGVNLSLWLSALISRPQDIVIVQQRLASGQKWHHGIACD